MKIKVKNLTKFNLYQTMCEVYYSIGVSELSVGFLTGLFRKNDGSPVSRQHVYLIMQQLIDDGCIKKIKRGVYKVNN